MATQASQDVGREIVVEAESGNSGMPPQTGDSEQISAAGSSSVAGGEHMFIETEVYTTTVDYVGNTELVHTDDDPNARQDDQQQQGEILEQETIELNSADHSMVVLDMAVTNNHVVEGEPIDDHGSQSVVVLSSYEDWLPEEKLYIVELAKTQNLDAICQLFGLSAEVVCTWVQENEGNNETFSAAVLQGYPEELDIALRDWVISEQSQYKFISTKMLQEQASLLIQPQCPEFVPSMTWLHQFLVQNGLALQLSIPSGSYSDVVAEVSNRDTLVAEEVQSSEVLNEQSKRKRVYPSAGGKSRKKIRLSDADPDIDGDFKVTGGKGPRSRGPYSTNRTVEFKKLAVELAKEKGLRPAARDLNISDSSLAYWMKIDLDSPREDRRRNNPNSGRPVKYGKELDMKLRNWVLKQYTKKQRLTISMICKKAQELITPECPDFMASRGWAQKFLKRYKLNVLNSKKAPTPEQLQEFASRLEASGVTLEDITDEAGGSTSESTDQVVYQSSAHLLSMFLENMKEQETSKDVTFKTTMDIEVLSSQHSQQQEDDQQQQLSQMVGFRYQSDQVPTGNTYDQVVNEDSYPQEAGDYEGEQNEAEYYEEFETSVVQPEEQVQVEIVGVELDESGNPKESINIHSEDGDHAQNKPTKSSPMPATTLSATENLSANQVTSLPAEVNQDTLTVSLEGTGIVPDSDAGIAETEVIVASSEVDDITTNNQVDCTIDMLIAAASQQSIKKDVQLTTACNASQTLS